MPRHLQPKMVKTVIDCQQIGDGASAYSQRLDIFHKPQPRRAVMLDSGVVDWFGFS